MRNEFPARRRTSSRLAAAVLALGATALGAAPAPAAAEPPRLEAVAAALRGAAAWQAEFSQRYLPAGFENGAEEHGVLTLAPPAALRFDYAAEPPRTFATDGAVARWVDPAGGSCTAVRLDASTWGRLPLAALLDPGAANAAFAIASEGSRLTLAAREPTPELASVVVEVGADALPARVTVVDGSGNRNELTFSGWRARPLPDAGHFRPALPGATPCEPDEE